jgi:hypothetical protein
MMFDYWLAALVTVGLLVTLCCVPSESPTGMSTISGDLRGRSCLHPPGRNRNTVFAARSGLDAKPHPCQYDPQLLIRCAFVRTDPNHQHARRL